MKKTISKISVISILSLIGLTFFISSCTKDLLDQESTTQLKTENFWLTESDATIALMGAYNATRACFDRDYLMDAHGEYVRVRGTGVQSSNVTGNPFFNSANSPTWTPVNYGDRFDNMFRGLYTAINRTNYVIENVKGMLPKALPTSVATLETVIAEARLLRGMCYFRLITMWGDVPYFTFVPTNNEEIQYLSRISMAQVKDSIMADFTEAFDKLPAPSKTLPLGRANKAAALALRGKLQLYWACWNQKGWPELTTFTPDAVEADSAYDRAARDFKAVINNYGLSLFRNGDPGSWGYRGDADILPNYFYLFQPNTSNVSDNTELVFGFTHGGTNTGQGEELMRDFAGRNHESSQLFVYPYYEIADRYQLTSTGDFGPKLVLPQLNASTAQINANRKAANGALNPSSYLGRDYRIKATLLWDSCMIQGMSSLKSTGMFPWIYKTNNAKVTIKGVEYMSINTDANTYGYIFRKFIRNYAGQGRSDGDLTWPVIRLADVYLMYAEATNERLGPQADAIALVNKVRARGALPALAATKTANKTAFFNAIEQERIVELIGEGHRGFDLRRWRRIETVWGAPQSAGVWRMDTYGAQRDRYFQNTNSLTYQRCYIFKIPQSERDRNPNLTQNTPWL